MSSGTITRTGSGEAIRLATKMNRNQNQLIHSHLVMYTVLLIVIALETAATYTK